VALIAPAALVAAPPRVALPFGLDSILAWRSGDRFESGVRWSSDPCGFALGRGGPGCIIEGDASTNIVGLPKELDNAPGIGEATPFAVYGTYACLLTGYSLSEAQDFANRHLTYGEIARAEQALWTGDLGSIPNFSGANGFPAPVSAGAHDTAKAALASVEYGIAREYSALGVIHMSRRTGSLLAGDFDQRGGRLYTQIGTPVVLGTGYPDTQEIIGSPALFGYRGEVITSSARPGDLLDRTNNTLYAIAEREYLIGMDPCPVVKATYTGEVAP
jgi:hypothetical protein